MSTIEALDAVQTKYPAVFDTIDAYLGTLGAPPPKASSVDGTYMSCGISLLNGLAGVPPEAIVAKILKARSFHDAKRIKEAFVLFSDTEHAQGGNKLYKYIRDNKLGNIVEFGPRMNPNTGNMIKLWVWEPPHESLEPKDRYMDLQGYVSVRNHMGSIVDYKLDTRFQENRNSREA